ncbi:hypothetical protein [Tsukamurella tyrosinosolvens]|uniref:hypothetical protein n=1 Tax=Tsukamurella tyrosinosolvens TaxID=57704 RepID=UPI002DD41F2C|nr:hypothetical protein [Tsukamurella tyrosinosolvens]MEC4613810.1 hypothetical protein [Tsukamurella tyrosinosolvens]
MIRFEPERVAFIVARYKAGAPSTELATQERVSKQVILRILREQGVSLRRRGLSEEEARRAVELYSGGLSVKRTAEQLGWSQAPVRAALVTYGATIRHP